MAKLHRPTRCASPGGQRAVYSSHRCEEGRAGIAVLFTGPRAPEKLGDLSKPLSIVRDKGAARIQEFRGLVPLYTCDVAGPILGARNAKVCALGT